jgi:dTDP-4-amino-4,6-dideoxygalactose transaminase
MLKSGAVSRRVPDSGSAAVRFVDLHAQIEDLQPALVHAMMAVLRRGDFILGADVDEFEREFASYCGVKHAVGLDSGISALELALRAVNVGPGDEVITQANTFTATIAAIVSVGATPILTDCDEQGAMDCEAVAAAITTRTSAIIPVHLFGRICAIMPILALADRHGLTVIEDACQAHGARWDGRRAGSFGLAAAFSFYPAKNLGAFGDAGALVTNSDAVCNFARAARNYGQSAKYQHVTLPLNRRLDTLQAAVLRVKLRHLDEWNARRQSLADAYREYLRDLPIRLPAAEPRDRHVYHLFVIETRDRDGLRTELLGQGIETGIHYPVPVHLQPAMQGLGYRTGAFKVAERLAAVSLSLPMYPELPANDVERVGLAIRRHFHG